MQLTHSVMYSTVDKPAITLPVKYRPRWRLSHNHSHRRPLRLHRLSLLPCLAAASSFGSSGFDSEDSQRVIELEAKLEAAERALEDERKRREAITPYLVGAPSRGIIGNSRYAVNLRKAVVTASRDPARKPVLIFGERGLEKDNIAALIHFGSRLHGQPMVKIDCERLDSDASELLGNKKKKGLLYWVPPEGTILLNNIHLAPQSVLPLLERQVATASIEASMMGSCDEEQLQDNLPVYDEATGNFYDAPGTPIAPLYQAPMYPRIIMTAETRIPQGIEAFSTIIKVPPLRVRPEDIDELSAFFLRKIARTRGQDRKAPPVAVSPEAKRQLKAHIYPANIEELKGMLERAVAQTTTQAAAAAEELDKNNSSSSNKNNAASATGGNNTFTTVPATAATYNTTASNSRSRSNMRLRIDEEVFWFASSVKDRYNINLLGLVPGLRQFLRSETWSETIPHGIVKWAFAAIVLILFIGPQDRDHNFALNVFWADWWALSFVAFPFLGRIWCSRICPFQVYGEVVQRWQMSRGVQLMKWPREILDQYGAWFLYALFFGILVWEEVWDLPQQAALSSWLLLLITFGSMICSFFFERKLWCRYLCPIGGMNGMFAKLAITELRARQGVCSSECSTYTCFKGGPATPPEGMESLGCPVYSHPAQLKDNRHCVLCMECLKACPHRSIEFRLRPPARDIWTGSHKAELAEVAMMYMLLGAVYLHHLPELSLQFGYDHIMFIQDKIPHIIVSSIVLAVPGLFALGGYSLWQVLGQALAGEVPSLASATLASGSIDLGDDSNRAIQVLQRSALAYKQQKAGALIVPPAKSFVDISYGMLPVVWGGTLAHYLHLFFNEAGLVLPIAFKTFGFEQPPTWIPTIIADPAVTEFLQGFVLTVGVAWGLTLTRRVGAQHWRALFPQVLLVSAFSAELWYLVVGH